MTLSLKNLPVTKLKRKAWAHVRALLVMVMPVSMFMSFGYFIIFTAGPEFKEIP